MQPVGLNIRFGIRSHEKFEQRLAHLHITNPTHQRGQFMIPQAAKTVRDCQARGKHIRLAWIPSHAGVPGNETADRLAVTTTAPHSAAETPLWLKDWFKSVAFGSISASLSGPKASSGWAMSRHLKRVDAALPGKHVKVLYYTLSRVEAQILTQLRTGHSKLRCFLAVIRAADTN